MDSSERFSIWIYFLVFLGTAIWLAIAQGMALREIFKDHRICLEWWGKCLLIAGFVPVLLAFLPLLACFTLLNLSDDKVWYEYLINISLMTTLSAILTNMSIALLQSHPEYDDELARHKTIGRLEIIDILSLSTSFIFAGSCAFFFCKRGHC